MTEFKFWPYRVDVNVKRENWMQLLNWLKHNLGEFGKQWTTKVNHTIQYQKVSIYTQSLENHLLVVLTWG